MTRLPQLQIDHLGPVAAVAVSEGDNASPKRAGPTRRSTAGRRRKRTLTEGLLESQQTKQLES